MNKTVHVFFGKFASIEAACRYTEIQWDEAPYIDASDEDHEAWAEGDHTSGLEDDLGVSLDADFVETIDGDLLPYLRTQLANETDYEKVLSRVPAESNILVLVMSEALGGAEATLGATPRLTYCGEYLWNDD